MAGTQKSNQYVYKIRGNQIFLFFIYEDSDGNKKLKKPDEAILSGLKIEYISSATPFVGSPSVPSETSVINTISSMLDKAIVSYLIAKLAEKAGNVEVKEYYLKEFKNWVGKHNSSRIVGARITSAGSPYAIR
jgi:hypothetical protein